MGPSLQILTALSYRCKMRTALQGVGHIEELDSCRHHRAMLLYPPGNSSSTPASLRRLHMTIESISSVSRTTFCRCLLRCVHLQTSCDVVAHLRW